MGKKGDEHVGVLYVDRLLWPVTALGPGQRIALWVSGCGHHCFHCANPELWERKPGQQIQAEKLQYVFRKMCTEKNVEGLTITGGEPFDQAEALLELLDAVTGIFPDILIYSGYEEKELKEDPVRKELLSRVDVLIDGPYIEAKNKPSIVLRGSENQRIIYRNSKVRKKYEAYLQKGRQIQNFVYDYKIISVGIHSNPGNTNSQELVYQSVPQGDKV